MAIVPPIIKLPTVTAPLAEFTSYLQLPEEPMECNMLQWWAAREATSPTVSKIIQKNTEIRCEFPKIKIIC